MHQYRHIACFVSSFAFCRLACIAYLLCLLVGLLVYCQLAMLVCLFLLWNWLIQLDYFTVCSLACSLTCLLVCSLASSFQFPCVVKWDYYGLVFTIIIIGQLELTIHMFNTFEPYRAHQIINSYSSYTAIHVVMLDYILSINSEQPIPTF